MTIRGAEGVVSGLLGIASAWVTYRVVATFVHEALSWSSTSGSGSASGLFWTLDFFYLVLPVLAALAGMVVAVRADLKRRWARVLLRLVGTVLVGTSLVPLMGYLVVLNPNAATEAQLVAVFTFLLTGIPGYFFFVIARRAFRNARAKVRP